MKICSYCGKENPDDAVVCLIDLTRLAPDVPVKSWRVNTVVDEAARPFAVKFAVSLLAFCEVLDLVRDIVRHLSHPYFHRSSDFYLWSIYIYGIGALLLYCIYRGKNWARWVLLYAIGLGAVVPLFVWIGPLHWNYYFHLLIDAMVAVALFQHSSNEWYKGWKQILNKPTPAT